MIRSYQESDTEDILEAWYQASLVAHSFLSEDFLVEERQAIRDVYLPSSQTWVYEEAGRPVGFISLAGSEVGGLFVHPSMQRRGIGRALMDKARSLHETLELEVFAANSSGRAFYANYGFVPICQIIDDATGFPAIRLRYGR